MAKLHWSATVAAVFYYFWLVGPLIYFLSSFFIYKIRTDHWPRGRGGVLTAYEYIRGMNTTFTSVDVEFFMFPINQAMTLIFGIIYGLQSGSSSKLGAWLYFGLSQILMLIPYSLFLYDAWSAKYEIISVTMPIVWFFMTLVLFSPLGNHVSSQQNTKIYLTVGTAFVVGYFGSLFYMTDTRIMMAMLVLPLTATILISIAFRGLEKEKTKKNEESSEDMYLVASGVPAHGVYYGSAPQPASVIITA
jgi:hypothetical protein